MDIDQNEVTFVGAYTLLGATKSNRGCLQEDLEFLSFSAPSLLQGQKQVFAIHGLPLKAVYRDAIVGIRYQHPRVATAGTTPASSHSSTVICRCF